MEHTFKRVVILLNDLEKMETLLKKGVAFSNEHDALLEVLFVHEVPLFEVPDYFLSDEKIAKNTLNKEKVKEKIETYLEDLNFEKEHVVFVYNNNTVDRLTTLLSTNEDSLVLTQYHEALSSELIEETPYTFWITKENKPYENIAFPIDLKDKFRPYMPVVTHIFPEAKIELIHDYRYILDPIVTSQDYLIVSPITTEVDIEVNKVRRDNQAETFKNYMEEFNLKGTFLDSDGVFNDDLIQYVQEHNFDLTILYRENEDIFFSSTLIGELIEEMATDFLVL
ncbi:MAG: Unknown protein [uncultured Sulfurovum sp.]|uniref:UspA domain-containing protein n=1 Tax=uncultured Sulfurovum sp. TaxID=269237 RepID=A0A6S6SGS9_9BACT|nr:MAG: Unknown protein [uncultured Sulfurovum sp.]